MQLALMNRHCSTCEVSGHPYLGLQGFHICADYAMVGIREPLQLNKLQIAVVTLQHTGISEGQQYGTKQLLCLLQACKSHAEAPAACCIPIMGHAVHQSGTRSTMMHAFLHYSLFHSPTQ